MIGVQYKAISDEALPSRKKGSSRHARVGTGVIEDPPHSATCEVFSEVEEKERPLRRLPAPVIGAAGAVGLQWADANNTVSSAVSIRDQQGTGRQSRHSALGSRGHNLLTRIRIEAGQVGVARHWAAICLLSIKDVHFFDLDEWEADFFMVLSCSWQYSWRGPC